MWIQVTVSPGVRTLVNFNRVDYFQEMTDGKTVLIFERSEPTPDHSGPAYLVLEDRYEEIRSLIYKHQEGR